MGQNIFAKVDTRSERQRAYVMLCESNSKVHIQLPTKDIVKCRPISLRDSRLIVKPESFVPDGSIFLDAIVTFGMGAEKYFLKTSFHVDGQGQCSVNIESPLFKLQRRNSFRVSIPAGYGAKTEILSVNDKESHYKLQLSDLSAGGFACEVNGQQVPLEKGNIIKGFVLVGGKFRKPFEGIVRHVGNIGSKGSGLKKIGVEFQNLSNMDREAFMKITWELHRDMFSTFKISSR